MFQIILEARVSIVVKNLGHNWISHPTNPNIIYVVCKTSSLGSKWNMCIIWIRLVNFIAWIIGVFLWFLLRQFCQNSGYLLRTKLILIWNQVELKKSGFTFCEEQPIIINRPLDWDKSSDDMHNTTLYCVTVNLRYYICPSSTCSSLFKWFSISFVHEILLSAANCPSLKIALDTILYVENFFWGPIGEEYTWGLVFHLW